MPRIRKIFQTYYPFIIVTALFAFYILTVPVMNRELTPCLKGLKGVSYAARDCSSLLILDRYLLFSAIGFITAVFGVMFAAKEFKPKLIMITGCLFAAIIIAGYYLYTPEAINAATKSAIYLDSIN